MAHINSPSSWEFLPYYELPFWNNNKTVVTNNKNVKKQAFIASVIVGIIAVIMLLITKIHKRP